MRPTMGCKLITSRQKISSDSNVWYDGQAFSFEDRQCYQCWCVPTADYSEPLHEIGQSDEVVINFHCLVTLLGTSYERTDFVVQPGEDITAAIDDFTGGCAWAFVTHPQQESHQVVAIVHWDCVASKERPIEFGLRGTLMVRGSCFWEPVVILKGLCPVDSDWSPDGVVLSNGLCVDEWTTGIPAGQGDLVLWISPSSDPESVGSLEEAPCPSDRWCAESGTATPLFGEDVVKEFSTWIDWHTPLWTKHCNPVGEKAKEFAVASTPRVCLSLEATLPTRQHLPAGDQRRIQVHSEHWDSLLSSEPTQLAAIPDGLQLHPATAHALQGGSEDGELLEIYIDGSSGDCGAGYSVVAVRVGSLGQASFQGCIYGWICTNEVDTGWVGAHSTGNIDAELQAMLVAQIVALTCYKQEHVVIRPDLQFSHHLAALRVGSREDSVLPAMVAALGSVLGQQVAIQEVRGHTGNPWNELADRLAKFAMHHQTRGGSFPTQALRFLATHKLQREWLWWRHGSQHHRAAFPSENCNGEWLLTPSNEVVLPVHVADSPQERVERIALVIATVNTCSVRGTEIPTGRIKGARATRLDHQLHQAGVAIAGLQETRMPQGQRTTSHYNVYASGNQQCGKSIHFGTEIWVSKTIAIAHDAAGTPIYLGKEKPTVLYADPRRLALRFDGAFRFTVIAAHAPCLSPHNSSDEVEQWWQDMACICCDIDDGHGLVCCMDANAPLASHSTECYGMSGAETPNRQTRWFQNFLDKTQLHVPATLGCHTGPQHTWIHPKGFKLRRDYVLISRSWFPLVRQSYTLQNFDMGLAHVDHAPAILDLKGVLVCQPKTSQMIDHQALCSVDGQRRFQEALCTLPMPTWEIHVDQHCDYLQANVMNIARQVFTRTASRKKERPQLQESTLNLINFKRQVLQMIRTAPDEQLQEMKVELRAIEKVVRSKVADDQRAWYDEWVRDIQTSGAIHDHKQVYQKLIRLGRKRSGAPKVRPLPMLRNADGNLAGDYAEVQAIFCEQFAELEAGILVDQRALQNRNTSPAPLPQHLLDLDFIPSLWQLQRILMRFKNGKAPGKSGLTVEIFRAGGLSMIHQFLPLMVKAVVHTHEPLQWKGGRLFALYKGKGDPSSPKSFRSIFLSELAAKMLHAMVRTRLETCWEQQIKEIQHGGRRYHSTDTAHHIVQAHMAWARESNVCSAEVFIDLKAAFYSVFRQSLIGGEWKASEMEFLLSKLNVAADEWQEILNTTQADDATAALNSHVRSMLQDMFTATFFEMTAVADKVATARGTRPGDPVGDILFNMLFRLILQEVRQEVSRHSEAEWMGASTGDNGVFPAGPIPKAGFAEIAFVDDVVYMVHASSPDSTVKLVQFLLSTFKDAAAKRGLLMNFEDGKTEVLLNLAGKGSRQFRSKVWHEMHGRIPIITEKETCFVRAVHQYKHLGSFLQEKAIPSKDRGCRVAEARKAAGALVKPFFAKSQVNLATKAPIFAALVISRHLYNVHTWARASADEMDKWAGGLRDTVRKMIGLHQDDVAWYQLATEDLYALAGLDAPLDGLHAARLRYVKRAIKVAPPILWKLLWSTHSPQSWLPRLQESFAWFARHYPHPTFEAPVDLAGWLTMVAVDGSWKGRVKAALKACKQFRIRNAEGKRWTLSMIQNISRGGGTMQTQAVSGGDGWCCSVCHMSFRSKRAVAMHASKVHGYRQKAKYFVLGEDCMACGKRFFSRQRNIRHFQMSQTCSAWIMACFAPADEDTVEAADVVDRQYAQKMLRQGWQPVKALCPPLKVPMAALPPSMSEEAQEMRGKWEERYGNDPKGYQVADQWRLVSCGGDEYQQANPLDLGNTHSYVVNSDGGQWQGTDGVYALSGPSVFSAASSIVSRVFVHFFSGFRRKGDLQHQIESHTIAGRFHIFCISIDICLAKAFSDLTEHKNLLWWKERILSGQIIGLGGGPSCETWSAARWATTSAQLCAALGATCLGLQSASSTHGWDEVGAFLAAAPCLVVAAAKGLMGFLEPPAFPTWAEDRSPCSIWSLEVVMALCKLECFQVATFDQCLWGCRARKPTTFLVLRMKSLHRQLLSRGFNGRCNHFRRHVALQGRNFSGDFRTAIAKVYPPALNRLIGDAIVQQVATSHDGHEVASCLPEIFDQLVSNSFVESEFVQPDYAPQLSGS